MEQACGGEVGWRHPPVGCGCGGGQLGQTVTQYRTAHAVAGTSPVRGGRSPAALDEAGAFVSGVSEGDLWRVVVGAGEVDMVEAVVVAVGEAAFASQSLQPISSGRAAFLGDLAASDVLEALVGLLAVAGEGGRGRGHG